MNKIIKHNQKYEKGLVSHKMGPNKFADMSHSEFVKTRHGYKAIDGDYLRKNASPYKSPKNVTLPETVDWREKGAVTPIKDQESCNDCWAFGTIAAVESQYFLKTGELIPLSEQNLLDCTPPGMNNPDYCTYGFHARTALEYIIENGGIDTEEYYPYENKKGNCRFNASDVGATVRRIGFTPAGDEEKLKEAVATIGPLVIAMDASHPSFHLYNESIYYEPECSSLNLNHNVALIGYGTDEKTGEDYWLIKNQWGTSWGLQGYAKLARNKNNSCGIATSAHYPII